MATAQDVLFLEEMFHEVAKPRDIFFAKMLSKHGKWIPDWLTLCSLSFVCRRFYIFAFNILQLAGKERKYAHPLQLLICALQTNRFQLALHLASEYNVKFRCRGLIGQS